MIDSGAPSGEDTSGKNPLALILEGNIMNSALTRRDILASICGLPALAFPLDATAASGGSIYDPCREIARQAIANGEVPSVAVAVFRNGKIDWEEAFGWADRERRIAATPRTSYSLASISKSFTATALMTLVASGRMKLEDPINNHLAAGKVHAWIGKADDITIGRVADHTGGLPFHAQFFYEDTPFRRPPQAETIAKWGKTIARPGERYAYSNIGYGLLGYAVERASGQRFDRALEAAVLAPLDLRDSALGTPTRSGARVASRYTKKGVLLPDYTTDHAGASEVYSSAHDLIRFAAFHLKAKLPGQRAILREDQIDDMHICRSRPGSPYGYGIGFSRRSRNGYDIVSHGGAMPGVATEMMLVPSEGIAIVVLANSWSSPTVSRIANAIAAAILPGWTEEPSRPGEADAEKEKMPLPPALQGRWSGHVSRPEGDLPVRIEIGADSEATARFGDAAAAKLEGLAYSNGRLNGRIAAPLEAIDTQRYPNTMRLDLKLEGTRLYGATVALDDMASQTFIAGLSFWTDLAKGGQTGNSAS